VDRSVAPAAYFIARTNHESKNFLLNAKAFCFVAFIELKLFVFCHVERSPSDPALAGGVRTSRNIPRMSPLPCYVREFSESFFVAHDASAS
jgi:hypothetical protein